MSMISKELLSEVLGGEVIQLNNISEVYGVHYEIQKMDGIKLQNINIHELAHKCKEWANSQGYGLSVHTSEISGYIVEINYAFDITDFHNTSEPEAIFKACQWVLDNKDK